MLYRSRKFLNSFGSNFLIRPLLLLFQFGSLFGAAAKWILEHNTDVEARAREETLQSALAVAESLKKELSEKAEEARGSVTRVRELEEREE